MVRNQLGYLLELVTGYLLESPCNTKHGLVTWNDIVDSDGFSYGGFLPVAPILCEFDSHQGHLI